MADDLKEISVLIVDDEVSAQSLISFYLEKMGFDKISAVDGGEEALEYMENGKPGLIICDWNMPEMSGLELNDKLQANEQWKYIPFLLLTAHNDQQKIADALQAGIKYYVTKPLDPERLESKVRRILDLG